MYSSSHPNRRYCQPLIAISTPEYRIMLTPLEPVCSKVLQAIKPPRRIPLEPQIHAHSRVDLRPNFISSCCLGKESI